MPTLSIVIPCHNEAAAIPAVLSSLARVKESMIAAGLIDSCQVIVVDDASSDETPNLLRAIPWVETVALPLNSGYGAALKAGFERCKGDWIAFLDLDGTYDPEDLPILLDKFRHSDLAFFLGERLSTGLGMPPVRTAGNFFFTWLVRSLYRQSVNDVCTGCRIFHRRWLPEILNLPNSGLDFSLAMTLWALKHGVDIREVPIRYHERTGQSKLSVVSDGNRFLWTILRSRYTRKVALVAPAE